MVIRERHTRLILLSGNMIWLILLGSNMTWFIYVTCLLSWGDLYDDNV